jgi:hypothetical protein
MCVPTLNKVGIALLYNRALQALRYNMVACSASNLVETFTQYLAD